LVVCRFLCAKVVSRLVRPRVTAVYYGTTDIHHLTATFLVKWGYPVPVLPWVSSSRPLHPFGIDKKTFHTVFNTNSIPIMSSSASPVSDSACLHRCTTFFATVSRHLCLFPSLTALLRLPHFQFFHVYLSSSFLSYLYIGVTHEYPVLWYTFLRNHSPVVTFIYFLWHHIYSMKESMVLVTLPGKYFANSFPSLFAVAFETLSV